MSRTLHQRLKRLERGRLPSGRSHIIWGMTKGEFESGTAELLASARWREGDSITRLSWMAKDAANPRALA